MSADSTAPSPARKERRVTWDANVAGGNPSTKVAIAERSNPAAETAKIYTHTEASNTVVQNGADMPKLNNETLAYDTVKALPRLNPGTILPEDLVIAEFDEVVPCSQSEVSIINGGTLERGDRDFDVAVRASVPYPAS